MTLFEECIEALGKDAKILPKDVVEKILAKFDNDYPMTSWGRIDWDKVKEKKIISSIEEIVPALKAEKRNPFSLVFVIGSDPTIPILESKLDKILDSFDDVEAVSPNTWLYCPSDGWVIEIYHDGNITLGLV